MDFTHTKRHRTDLVLIDADADKLLAWKEAISRFVDERLRLRINERATRLAPVSGGVDFAGFIVRPKYRLVRRRVVGNLKEKLDSMKGRLVCETTDCTIYRFDRQTLESCLATVNSYFGHFKHAKTHKLQQNLWQKYTFLQKFFTLSSHKITPHYKPPRYARTLQRQIRWFQQKYKHCLCLVEVGCYYEFFGEQARTASEMLKLRLHKNWRGFRFGCGFHMRLLPKMLARLKAQRISVVVVQQTGRELHWTKERLPYYLIEFQEEKPGTENAGK